MHLEISKHPNVQRVSKAIEAICRVKQCLPSLVCQAHADIVISKRLNLKFKKLTEPIPVSVADARSKLSAVVTIQVPIVWYRGKESIFTVLVVQQLSWHNLFGENHLHSTTALYIVDHAVPCIEFRHQSMQLAITKMMTAFTFC